MNPLMPFLRWTFALRVRQALLIPSTIIEDAIYGPEFRVEPAYEGYDFLNMVKYMVDERVAMTLYASMYYDWWEVMGR